MLIKPQMLIKINALWFGELRAIFIAHDEENDKNSAFLMLLQNK